MIEKIKVQIAALFASDISKWAILLFMLALIPRILWAVTDHPRPFSDMEDYYYCAINLLKGDYLAQAPDRLAYRAPMYPLFLAAVIQIFPSNPLAAIRIVQSVLGSISAVLVFFITKSLLYQSKRLKLVHLVNIASFITGLAYAWMAYPIFFSSVLMTETLFIVMLLIWMLWGMHLNEGSSNWSKTGFSILLGLMALVRPIALFFLPIALWRIYSILPKKDNSFKYFANYAAFAAWLLPILPWMIRNILVFNTFVFITTNSGVNLFLGNNPTFGYYASGYKEEIRKEFIEIHGADEAAEDRLFLRLGADYIAQHPAEALKRCWYKFYFLNLLDKEPWPWEEYNKGQGLKFAFNINWPTFRWTPWFLVLALIGIINASIYKCRHAIMLQVILCYTLACLIFFARTRFRLPLEPILTIYMGVGVMALVEQFLWGYRNLLKK